MNIGRFEMNLVDSKIEKISLLIIVVASFIFVFINSWSTDQGVSEFIAIVIITLYITLTIGVIYGPFKIIWGFLDTYIDGMFLGKKISDTFYCQVCKCKVGPDDSYCSNCGMTM